jgi:putative phosphoribosyl transferase
MNAQSATEVVIRCADVLLEGSLVEPPVSRGVVLFAHGSGSSRHSPRNVAVARALHEFGCSTLLMDLLTMNESANRSNVFDIPLLGERLVDITQWWWREHGDSHPVGYFGASTGAAAALVAAAELGKSIRAVVSRGGRPDLAGSSLANVTAPTLLLVGSHDEAVIDLNEQAQKQLRCTNRLAIIPGATHLFEEPGTLEQVSQLAGQWFQHYFC